MNLADIIRQASMNVAPSEEGTGVPFASAHKPLECGNAIRLEMFLSPEQANNLLKALVHGQQSLLTLTEASAFLRVRATTVAKLANEGQIPAALVDGKWRFQRHELQSWLDAGAERAQQENHVA